MIDIETQETPLLLTASICRTLRSYTDELDNTIIATNAISYPCGSFEVHSSQVRMLNPIWHSLELNSLIASKRFRSLPPFGNTVYTLWYEEKYRVKLDPKAFGIVPALLPVTSSYKTDLSSLVVSVIFRKRITPQRADEFAQCIRQHILPHAQIQLRNDSARLSSKLFQIALNITNGSQYYINLFVLRLLEYGYEVEPINGVIFGHEQELELFIGDSPVFTREIKL